MLISGFVALSLLSARELIGADGAVFKADPKRFQRILQRVESATGPGAGSRQLKGGDGKNKGGVRVLKKKAKDDNKKAGGGARATDDSGKKGKEGKKGDSGGGRATDDSGKKGKKGEGKNKGDKGGVRTTNGKATKKGLNDSGRDSNGAQHSAHMDNNVNGIDSVPPGIVEYSYDEQISMTIEMNNDLVTEEIRRGLDLSTKDQWLIGVYMRMEDVDSNEPIATAIPSITCEEVAAPATERKLQDANATEAEAPPSDEGEGSNVDAEAETPEGPDEPDEQEPIDLLCTGTANFTETGKDTLKRKDYGDGFDVWMTDGDGKKINGPMTFYMMQSEEDIEAEEAAAKSKPDHHLAKYDHAGKKKKKGGNGKSGKEADPANAGEGTGMDGKPIISTKEDFLADYYLDVTSDTGLYVKGDVVTVTYDLNPAAEAEERRRLQAPSEGEEGTTGATDPAPDATGTPSPEDEADVTTTGPTEPEVDMGAGEDPVDPDADVDEEEECDPEDVAEFVMAVYMRMAHPQRGALAPILSQKFCAEDPCTTTAEELEFGSFDFDTSQLDDKKYGLGYDLWVLNCLGEGKAGPVTFYIEPEGGL